MHGVVPCRTTDDARATSGRILAAWGDDRELVSDVLRADGYELRVARDARELSQWVAAWAPDLVILGWDLEALAHVRALRPLAPIIVIAPSERYEDARDQALALGASAVFAEPLDVDDLRTAVLNLAATKKAARAIARPLAGSAIEEALSRCIFALRDVAAERAHTLIGASTLHALRGALDAAEAPTEDQRRAAETLTAAFVRFQNERAHSSVVVARYRLELAALSVLESSAWRG